MCEFTSVNMPAINHARKRKAPKPGRPEGAATRFPGSVIFCREQNPPVSHSHLYRVLTGDRESKRLLSRYAAWLKKNGFQWPQTAIAPPTA